MSETENQTPTQPAPTTQASDSAPTPPVAPQPLPPEAVPPAPKPAEPPPAEKPKEMPKVTPTPHLPGTLGEKFKALAAAEGLDDAKQSKLAEFYQGIRADEAAAQETEFQQMKQGWREELRNDKAIGGHNFDASIATADKGIRWAGGEDLSRILESTGLAHHPTIVKAFLKLGRALSEDSVAGTTAQGSGAPSADDVLAALYPTMHSQH